MSIQSALRCLSQLIYGNAKWVAAHFFFVVVMGGFMGFMSTAIAQAAEYQQWGNILSGALGASGAFGFELVIKRLLGLAVE